jgi:gliding motility-associated-like protein
MKYNLPRFLYKIHITLIICLSIAINTNAQFSINTNLTPTQYIDNLVGTGVSFSNVTYTGNTQASGLFNYGGANLGFSQGIMLSTGLASDADGARIGFAATTGFGVFSDYDELETYVNCTGLSPAPPPAPGQTQDGVRLEFDFIPQSTPISFKYIFASEEYDNFVCSSYNDAFAFIIEGPGFPSGGQNLALIPGSGFPITINTVNNGIVGSSGSATNNPCELGNSAFYNMMPPDDIVYNGYTKVMTAVANVTVCQTYTLTLILADGCDGNYDSAVFLEANSFGTAPVAISQTTLNGDETTYEGCAPASLEFTIDAPEPADYTFPFWLGISSTAIDGVDFATLPGFVTIPAGQTSQTITIEAFDDSNTEGTEGVETVVIEYLTICGTVSTSINITEKPPINLITGPSQAICDGSGPETFSCSATGGLRPYTYSCLNGNPIMVNDSTFTVNPATTTTYVLQIEDYCGTIDTAHVIVYVGTTPAAPIINGPISSCVGLPLTLATTTSADFYSWSGPAFLPGPDITSNSFIIIPITALSDAGNYSLKVINEGCESSPTIFQVNLTDASFIPTININSPVCENENIVLSTTPRSNAEYHWSGPNSFTSNADSETLLSATESYEGIYELYIVIGACTTIVNQSNLVVNPIPIADAGVDLDLCSMEVGQLGTASISNYSYTWIPADGLSSNTVSNPTIQIGNFSAGSIDSVYTLQVESFGCVKDTFVTLHITANPVASFVAPDPECFEDNLFNFQADGIYNPTNAQFFWDFGAWADTPNSSDPNPQGIHFNATGPQLVSLKVTEQSCTSNLFMASVNVLKMPVANFSINTTQTCSPSLVKFQNLSENNNYPFTSEWTFSNGETSTQLNPFIIFNEPGEFDATLMVTGSNGCSNSYYMPGVVQINPSPVSNFNVSPIVASIYDPEFTLNDYSTNADSCRYAMGNGDTISVFDTVYTYADTGSYLITQLVSNEFGCHDTSYTNVRVDFGYKIFIPTSFSPNDDGLNDRFTVYGEDILDFSMTVYNRWGQMLYRTFDKDNGWDGKTQLSESLVGNDTYFYVIKLRDKLGNLHIYEGNFNILR